MVRLMGINFKIVVDEGLWGRLVVRNNIVNKINHINNLLLGEFIYIN